MTTSITALHDPQQLARLIDHTVLRANALQSEIEKLCDEALQYGFYAVCLQPRWLPLASARLSKSKVLPITVVGFPLGANQSAVKAEETRAAIGTGAREIDMVIDVGAFLSGLSSEVVADIEGVVKAAGSVPVKVILETCYLSPDQIRELCRICVRSGAAFVKSSTGFGPRGATVEQIRTMRETVGPEFGVKASGGVRDLESVHAMIRAGANRIGSSNSVEIVQKALLLQKEKS